MYSDPGIIPRPADYIEKKAKWEVEEKKKLEEISKKRMENAKKKFGEMRREDYDDTPIPMNDTINSDKDTDVEPTDLEKAIAESENRKKQILAGVQDDHKHDGGDCCDQLHIHTVRFCGTCQIDKPPLASHCSMCGHCVKGFDHHCTVTNCCVGARNFRNFVLLQFFIGLTAFASIVIVPLYYYEIVSSYDKDSDLSIYFHKNWKNMIIWHISGAIAAGLTMVGAIPCCIFGFIGFGMSTWTIFEGMWGE
jgi:hypothetical protein